MESPAKLFLIIVFAFILFGAKKLPEFGSSAGKALFEFKKALNNVKGETESNLDQKENH